MSHPKLPVSLSTLLVVIISSTSVFSQTGFWQQTQGPYLAGNVLSFAVSPSGEIYAGIENVGVYRSTDGGLSWHLSSSALGGTRIVAITTNKNGDIFAADYNFYSDHGVFRSTDHGTTWTQINSGLTLTQLRCLAVDSSGTIYVGENGYGVFRSTNNGDNWIEANSGIGNRIILSLAADSTGNVFAGTSAYVGDVTGVFRSTNHGVSWFPASAGLSPDTVVLSLSVGTGDELFAGASSGTGGRSVYRSTNNGNSWIKKSTGLVHGGGFSFAMRRNHDTLYTSGAYLQEILRSTDNGENWTLMYQSNYPANGDLFYTLASDANGTMFAGSQVGVKRSTDAGETWLQSDNGFDASQILALTFFPHGPLYAVARNGEFRSIDRGTNWIATTSPPSPRSFSVSPNGNYFLSDYGSVYQSIDSGTNWARVGFGNIGDFPRPTVGGLTVTPDGYIIAGGAWNGMYHDQYSFIKRSTDNGSTWPGVYAQGFGGNITSIIWGPGNLLFACGDVNGVLRSSDSGATWSPATSGIPMPEHTTLVGADPGGFVFAGHSSNGMFRSTDDGESWNSINVGLTSPDITALLLIPKGGMFVATTGGVFRSTNRGDTWMEMNGGLTDLAVLSLAYDSDGFLYAGTQTSGVFRSASPVTSVREMLRDLRPKFFQLYQNLPNPFNPTTSISYSIPKYAYVQLQVFNPLGQLITTLVHEDKPPGTYTVSWDASTKPSGLYFYRMTAGGFVETKKAILIR